MNLICYGDKYFQLYHISHFSNFELSDLKMSQAKKYFFDGLSVFLSFSLSALVVLPVL
jgi:hypothetical protein